jgi:hypothetical protein
LHLSKKDLHSFQCGQGAETKTCTPFFYLDFKVKKITKPQGFTSLLEAQLHLKPKVFFTSSPNSGSLACLSRHSSQSDGG